MVFERVDGPFSSIALVYMWWDELHGAVVGRDGGTEDGAGFVVKDVDGRGRPCSSNALVEVLIGWDSVSVTFGCKWLDKDGL